MNKLGLIQKRKEVLGSYHIPGCCNYYKRPKNAIYFNPSNSLSHELKKAEICYNLQKEKKQFITEAVDNQTGLRRDIVCLDDEEIYEIETTASRAARHSKNINVIMVKNEK